MDLTIPSLNVLFGPEFVGMSIAWACFGGTLGQTMFYYHNYPKDNLMQKSMTLWSEFVTRHYDVQGALGWMKGGYLVRYGYYLSEHVTTTDMPLPPGLDDFVQSLGLSTLSSTIDMRCAFLYEIHRDSANIDASLARVKILGRMQAVMELAVNTYITVTISLILHKSKSEDRQTGSRISKLIRYTVNRGIVLFMMRKDNGTASSANTSSILSVQVLSSVNANTVMIALNMRHYVNEAKNGDCSSHYSEAISKFEARVPSSLSTRPQHLRENSAYGGQLCDTRAGEQPLPEPQIMSITTVHCDDHSAKPARALYPDVRQYWHGVPTAVEQE
ncbi:hypothetical protein WOLCODRAFT_146239 [Wolfiporia cocos MD-104 SS10]|uniref:DUF6534 domain-containing protein n=1 Tax=Wolfiporia cocos (strain MD-104) TaxID=742152 RepID=A0A2H3JFC0_WOLCO|nr:hypothetical protein WOLCODRAFT_146239 [Wolfiporia cocos MD-104 SS10]